MGSCQLALPTVSTWAESLSTEYLQLTSVLDDHPGDTDRGVGCHLYRPQATPLVALLAQLRCPICEDNMSADLSVRHGFPAWWHSPLGGSSPTSESETATTQARCKARTKNSTEEEDVE